MSEPKLNIKEETSTKKTRSPPKKTRVEQSVPRKKKLKTDAEKAAEKAQHLRFGKAELTPDELSRLSKAQKREMYAAHAARSAMYREVDQYEDENVGVQALSEGEKAAGNVRDIAKSRYARKLKKKAKIETARAYYLAEHQDEPVGRIQNVAVTTLEKFRSGVRRRRNLAPRSLPENDVRFIDPMYNELFRVPDGGVVQITYPDGHQRSEVVEYLDDYHMKIGSSVQHICEFAERMARSRGIVEPEQLTQQEQRAWNLEYDYYLTVQADNGAWEYALYQGDCCLLERGKIDAPELMIEEVRDEILYTHNLRNKDCIPLTQEEFAQKLADRNEVQSYRMKQFQQSGHDCYLVMQLQQDADPALRFASMRSLNKQNIAPSVENYEILYRGNLPEGKRSVPQAELLEQLYQKFNCARPTDYHGHSLSVSDVIMLNQDGKISAHYVDSIGFKELPGFLDKKPERTSVLQTLKEKCDAPECNPTGCRKVRDAHEL